jgi:hypothetical protein
MTQDYDPQDNFHYLRQTSNEEKKLISEALWASGDVLEQEEGE